MRFGEGDDGVASVDRGRGSVGEVLDFELLCELEEDDLAGYVGFDVRGGILRVCAQEACQRSAPMRCETLSFNPCSGRMLLALTLTWMLGRTPALAARWQTMSISSSLKIFSRLSLSVTSTLYTLRHERVSSATVRMCRRFSSLIEAS